MGDEIAKLKATIEQMRNDYEDQAGDVERLTAALVAIKNCPGPCNSAYAHCLAGIANTALQG